MVKSKFYNLDTDTTLSENSDLYIPSQKATKTYIDTIASGKANVGLDNLNADGQMIIDSANGTISNCILEIQQNLKLTLENNVLTLKAGSVIVYGGSTYTTGTFAVDKSITIPSTQGRYVISPVGNYNVIAENIDNWGSGNTLPEQGTGTSTRWYKADTFTFYSRGTINSAWTTSAVVYPCCIIDVDSNGVASFAKDSNGNDMIFNGAGYIGHHAFVFPNVKALNPDGIDTDGTLKSKKVTISSLLIAEMASNLHTITISGANALQRRTGYSEVKEYVNPALGPQYVIPENIIIYNNLIRNETPFIFFDYNGTTVTDFTIRQPVRLATTEMLDKKQDTLISGTNIKTINNTSILGSGNIDLANFAWGSITGTLSDQTDLQNALNAKADDNNVVHKTGNETIAGNKTFTGTTTFKQSSITQYYNTTGYTRGTAPSSDTYLTHRYYTDSANNPVMDEYYYIPRTTNRPTYLLRFRDCNGSDPNVYKDIINCGWDGTNGYYNISDSTGITTRAPIPTEDTTSSKQIDTVGARNTKLQNYVPTSRKINDKALTSDITLDASDVSALPSSTTINDLTTTAQQNALNSGVTSTVVSQVTTNKNDISTINGKIPSAATTTNQLADKSFVNSSISTNTAYFIGTFNSVADLEAYSGTLTNNDYAFVISTDSAGNTVYNRYKYTTATNPASWQFEYALNNSSFTADQWAAINSGATTTNVGQITTNKNAIGTLSSLTTTEKSNLVGAINELDSEISSTTSKVLDFYGTCDTAAATQTKDVVCAGFSLKTGASIRVKFTNNQNYNGVFKLNVNSTGAIDVKRYGTTNSARYDYRAGEVISFTYDGTYWLMEDEGLADTTYFGKTKLTASATSTSTSLALTPSSLNSYAQNTIANYPVYSTSSTYAVGDRVRYNWQTWQCSTAITTAESWTAAHWTALPDLQTQIDGKADDSNVVHKTGNETVEGQKTFKDTIIREANVTSAGGGGVTSYMLTDTNTTSSGYIRNFMYYVGNQVINRHVSRNSISGKDMYLDITSRDNGTGRVGLGGSVTSFDNLTNVDSSTTSNAIATMGWVNNPATSTNVMHRSGDETAAGNKTFSGNTTFTSMPFIKQAQPNIAIQYTGISKGTAPSSTINGWFGTIFDKNGTAQANKLAQIYHSLYSNGSSDLTFALFVPTSGSTTNASISLKHNGTNFYTSCVAPTDDNTTSTQIDTVGARNTKLANYALDANVVHKTGAETVAGVKTFSDNINANTSVTVGQHAVMSYNSTTEALEFSFI